ncbi:hypothetical protein EV426DRAFT_704273 [Tirmania nivea]|nr:hypothetical protein EV426DRAFT_704273 [Tirmania nivea]
MSQPIVQAPASDACPLPSQAPGTKAGAAPKPCCTFLTKNHQCSLVTKPYITGVCKEEKARRDECMLFSSRGEEDCKPMIELYRMCMAGYGFKLP